MPQRCGTERAQKDGREEYGHTTNHQDDGNGGYNGNGPSIHGPTRNDPLVL